MFASINHNDLSAADGNDAYADACGWGGPSSSPNRLFSHRFRNKLSDRSYSSLSFERYPNKCGFHVLCYHTVLLCLGIL